MKTFNLLKEPWISVLEDEKGSLKEVSMIELFQNAHGYKRLAGETEPQNFAILRLLLSVMHTVFSRFNEEGNPYEWIKIDENFLQKDNLDKDDEEDYEEDLMQTWERLYHLEKLPSIIITYLEKWQEHFDLFHEEHPFCQVTDEELKKKNITKKGTINLKLINRLISESNNKIELFSPASEKSKNTLSIAALARWLVAFQGYTGTGDKAKFPGMTESASKGWLLGLGGIYLLGKNIKETLLLNLVLPQNLFQQTPIWEKEWDQKIQDLLDQKPNNLADLYTNCSRLLQIKEEKDNYVLQAVQLPGIDPQEFFLEPMTLWRVSKSGKDKDHFIPKTHNADQAFWRSFGQISWKTEKGKNKEGQTIENYQPGLITWHDKLVGEELIPSRSTTLVAVGLSYNRDASTMPNDEIFDELFIQNKVLADIKDQGWVIRIEEEVERTKRSINEPLRYFASNIKKIRNLGNDGFVNTVMQEAYYAVDQPFREWISSIQYQDEKEIKVQEWRAQLRRIILGQADQLLYSAGKRDFLGKATESIDKKGPKYLNIEIAYTLFLSQLNKLVPIQKGGNHEGNE